MNETINIVGFLVSLLTPLGFSIMIAGVIVGLMKGKWMLLIASSLGVALKLLMITVSKSRRE